MPQERFTFYEVCLLSRHTKRSLFNYFQLKYNQSKIFLDLLVSLPLTWSSAAVRPHSSATKKHSRTLGSPLIQTTSLSPSAAPLELSINLCQLYDAVVWTKVGVLSFLKGSYEVTDLMCRVTKTQGSLSVWVMSGFCVCMCVCVFVGQVCACMFVF